MKTPLRKAREGKKLTLGALARLVDSDVGNLSRIERGRQIPSSELAAKICALFPEDGLTELHLIYPERYLQQAQPDQAVINGDDRRRSQERRKSTPDRRTTAK